MDNPLYKAFTGNDDDMMAYFEATTADQMRFDFKDLLQGMVQAPTADLKDFTKAAMQGLCANAMLSDKMGPDAFAQDAVTIARATLSELQKQQS